MSAPIDDGGPAFPVPNDANVNEQPGMSLRDWFAGMALQGHLASQSIEVGYYSGSDAAKKAANDSYYYANAMIARRRAQ